MNARDVRDLYRALSGLGYVMGPFTCALGYHILALQAGGCCPSSLWPV